MYIELSRIKRPVWVNITKKKSTSVAMTSMPSISCYLCIWERGKELKLASQFMPFLKPLCLFSQWIWQPFPFSTTQDPPGVSLSPCWVSTVSRCLMLLPYVRYSVSQSVCVCVCMCYNTNINTQYCQVWIQLFIVNLISIQSITSASIKTKQAKAIELYAVPLRCIYSRISNI